MYRKAEKMAGTQNPIGKRKQTEEIPAKKGPENGIPRNFPEFRSEFPTKPQFELTSGWFFVWKDQG